MRVKYLGVLTLLLASNLFAANVYEWQLPNWIPKPIVPQDNPMSEEKVELGRHLFYDKRLSKDESIACSSCHIQKKAFTDGQAFSRGVNKKFGVRSAMSLTNVAYLPVFTWSNPQIATLEVQSLIPLFGEHPVEMGMSGQEEILFQRLKKDKVYQKLFKRAFPDEFKEGEGALYSLSTITKALASFERTLLSFNSPYDQYKYGGNVKAIAESAKRGERLFFGERMECYHCHGGFNFTDTVSHTRLPFPEKGFHNTGLYNLDGKGAYPFNNIGIAEFTGDSSDMGKFKTPTLRNIALTAPYMHDGSIKTIKDVLKKHYAQAGFASQSPKGISPLRHELITGFYLEDQDVSDLASFLNSLTDQSFIDNPKYSNPWIKLPSKK